MSQQIVQVGSLRPGLATVERRRLERRARMLAWGGIAWHFVEFAIAIGAGIAASSIALIGFGADSLIESVAGLVVIWLFTGSRLQSSGAERRAQQMIAWSFFVEWNNIHANHQVISDVLADVRRIRAERGLEV